MFLLYCAPDGQYTSIAVSRDTLLHEFINGYAYHGNQLNLYFVLAIKETTKTETISLLND